MHDNEWFLDWINPIDCSFYFKKTDQTIFQIIYFSNYPLL